MKIKGEERLVKTLRNLASKIEKSISQRMLQPEEEIYFQWKINKFEYGEEGIINPAASGDYITKKSWLRASIKVFEDIKKSEEYLSALELLNKLFRKPPSELDRFSQKVISSYLDDTEPNKKDVELLLTTFLRDLKGKPQKYGAEVDLEGIVILAPTIEFQVGDTNIVLRQTATKDLEKEFPAYQFASLPHLRTPSAILRIEFLGRQANEIQMKVEQSIAILRLFKTGGVRHTLYRMYSESITDIMASGTLTSGAPYSTFEKYVVRKEDIEKLKKFWQTMIKVLPQSFYELGERRLGHTDIAYNRYCDALLQNGISERRIANAVMGLEALFLKGGETQELNYRLRIRVAKIFVLLEYSPGEVKETIKDAYRIRNLFVHGSHLSYKDRKKVEHKYGDVRTFVHLLLDYLRISIIIWNFVKKEKEEVLDLIDDSLVDKNKENTLCNLVSAAKSIMKE